MIEPRRAAGRASILSGAVAIALSFVAQGQDLSFDIGAGDLKAALEAYAKQTGQQLVYQPDDVKGRTTPGVHGAMTPEQALTALLAGTGLKVQKDASGAIAIFPAEAVAGGASTETAGSEQKLEEVIVTATAISQIYITSRTLTRIDADPMLLPLSVSAVQQDLLQYQQAASIADVLANVSGVTTNGRGLSASRGFLMGTAQNGMPIGGFYGDTTSLLPVVATERVEVAKGPEQVLQGQAAGIGGTVNVISKVPTPGDYLFLGAAGGSHGYFRVDADVNGTLLDGKYGRLMGQLIGSTSSQDGLKGTVGTDNDFVSAGLRWTGDDSGSDMSVVYQHDHNDRGQAPVPLGGAHMHNGEKTYVLGDPKSHNDYTTEQVNVHVDQRIAGTWSLDLTYLWRHLAVNTYLYTAYGLGPPQVVVADQNKLLDTEATTEIYRAGINGQVDVGPVTNKLLLAYDYQWTDESNGGLRVTGTYYNEISAGTQLFVPSDPSTSASDPSWSTTSQPGWLLTDQVSWDKWHALLGVRWLTVRDKYAIGKPAYYGTKSDEDQTLPQYGLVYAVNPRFSLYVSGTDGFRAVSNMLQDAGGNVLPDITYTQYEGGAKLLMLDSQLALTVALYQMKEKDVPALDYYDPQSGSFVFTTISGITSKGVEIELAGQPIRGLQLRTTYAYTDSKDDKTGEPPPVVIVPNRFTLWSQYWFGRTPGQGWWAGGGLEAWDAPEAPSDQAKLPGATLFDVSAGYQKERWQAIVGVKNVGNVQAYYPAEARPIENTAYFSAQPVPGREYRFDVSFRL